MDTNQIIQDIIQKEGGFVNNPSDKGGATNFGITAMTLGRWRKLGRPATVEEVRSMTVQEAKDIYMTEYVVKPGFDRIPDSFLAAQMTDFGVNSGPLLVIHKLQDILGVPSDGQLGPGTLTALAGKDSRVVNNQLAVERVKMLGRIVTKTKTQVPFLSGWLTRALSFIR